MSNQPSTAQKKSLELCKVPANSRKEQRIHLRGFLGSSCLLSLEGVGEVKLVDISLEGCAFVVPHAKRLPAFSAQQEVAARLYLSPDTFIPLSFSVVNSRTIVEAGKKLELFGCKLHGTGAYAAVYEQFISFLKLYVSHAQRDLGDVSVSYL